MAMLSEKRQRKSYNLLSRGKALYEDDLNFGLKMLEKMGWSKGKGLGANEDGNVDFVRVRYKNNAEGFGYEDRDDQWTNHDADFNSLLNNLNSNSNDNEVPTNTVDTIGIVNVGLDFEKKNGKLKGNFSGESLEEKSKSSRARVHYKKFTRGKDLSRYSEKDLANIFGKKCSDQQTIDSEITDVEGAFKQKNKRHQAVQENSAVVKNSQKAVENSLELSEPVKTKESTATDHEIVNIIQTKDLYDINMEIIDDNSKKDKVKNVHVKIDNSQKNISKNGNVKIVQVKDEKNLPTFTSYEISSFCAEKFRKTDVCKFEGSNLSNIIGYSFDENLTLKIVNIENDEERINKLWSSTANKYLNDLHSDRFKKYVKDVRVAYKAKQRLPKFNVKTWKRRKAFQNI